MDGGRQLGHFALRQGHCNPQKTAAFDRAGAVDRLSVFLEGVTPPGRRNGELSLSKAVIAMAREKGISPEVLAIKAGMQEERLKHILGGLVRADSLEQAELASIAKIIGADAAELRRISTDKEDTGIRINRRGLNIVFSEMTRDTELHPGMHVSGASFGVGMRSIRTRLGIRRRLLSAESKQSPGLIIIGEHCILPDEALGHATSLARTLGCSVERLCEEGTWIMRKLGVSLFEEGPAELLGIVKRFIYSRLI